MSIINPLRRSGVNIRLIAFPKGKGSKLRGARFRKKSHPRQGLALEFFANRVHFLARLGDIGVEVAAMIREKAIGGAVEHDERLH